MTKLFTLLNVDDGVYAESMVIDETNTSIRGDAQWSIRFQRLRGGLSDGVDVIWLDNGCTKLAILPTRGMNIWKGETVGLPLKWDSPVERPVHPSFVDPMRRGGIGWLDGFNELICRCGLGWHGAPGNDVIKDSEGNIVSEQFLPLHGRISNLPAHDVRVEVTDDGAISVIGIVDEASMFGGRLRMTSRLTTYIGSNTFEVTDSVQNLGATTAEAEMLYHCNFGQPILNDGARFLTAATEVAPRNDRAAENIETWTTYRGPETGYAEQVYFAKPISDDQGRGLAVLQSADGDNAVAIRFDTSTLPWLVLWKNTQAVEDGYCTGIEPGSSFPNLRTFEREKGRVISLQPQQTVTFDLSFTIAVTNDDVNSLVSEVETLQSDHKMLVHEKPNADWSD